jgi:hypothetical protein
MGKPPMFSKHLSGEIVKFDITRFIPNFDSNTQTPLFSRFSIITFDSIGVFLMAFNLKKL